MSDTLWITGAAGFTGRHLAAFVASLPDAPRVIGLDLRDGALPGVDVVHAVDLSDSGAVCAIATALPPRWIIHLAGLMPPAGEADMWRANVGGTMGLIAGLRRAGHRDFRLVTIGSAAEYAPDLVDPIREDAPTGGASAYGNTKLAQSVVCLHAGAESGFQAIVARTFNLIGPGLPTRLVAASLVSQFAAAGVDGVVRTGNTHTARDFVDVRDAVRAYWLLAANQGARGIFNVCSGAAWSVSQLLDVLGRVAGHSVRTERDPSRVRAGDPARVVGDFTRLREATGWRPEIPLEASLRDMLIEE